MTLPRFEPDENSLTLPGTPALHHSPHLPLPRPWLLIREADAEGLRIYFAILNFKRLAGIEPGILLWRASYLPLSWAGYTGKLYKFQALSPTPPPLHHSPHLPLPRPWLLIREADAEGLRIYFAILNFERLAGIEPGTFPWRGLIHTTELDRLCKPQALSPPLPPLPPSSPARDAVQKFKFHAPAANAVLKPLP